ncbi:hypothetical protein L3Y34_009649 [Caenorhabditis briggsae]|uniref:DUF38 domain-containing protein n=1 Tax=Caenorhabditis briggsae TaxID=6238 RepID=A0AAE9A6K3_CAEBR|nr:hypothetical protein L3Y34_009649 [Caenorhabditis briggsae]
MAKVFGCGQYFSDEHIKELTHFSKSSILTEHVSAEDVIHLKECFMKSSTFEYCYLTMNSPTSEIEDFVKLWGPSDVSGTDEKWYFRMVNSDILVVSVELEDTWPYRTDFNLFRKKISDIESDRVFIHD